MKPLLLKLVQDSADPQRAKNEVREALQAKILASLQRSGAMIPLAFHGGTALRFLFSIGRFSEDLDFALERPGRGYDFRSYLRTIQKELRRESFTTEIKINDSKVVHSAFVRLPGLLFELGLSPHRKEILAIKMEVDTRPPSEAVLTTTVIRRHRTLQIQHHDQASLLAGKLHAVLQRHYTKGRDIYDLIWYLSDRSWPSPNLGMLNQALRQSDWNKPDLTETTWRGRVLEKLDDLDWPRVRLDLQPFLESAEELELVTYENVQRLLAATAPRKPGR